jgi:hypothetical protein
MPKTEEKRKPRPGSKPAPRKKNESLELLRNVAKSMAGAVPFTSDETKATIEDSLARPIAGLSSQLMGYNEETGNVENAALANLRRIWNADERRKKGLPPEKRVLPGIVTDTGSLLNMFGNGPEWSQKMEGLANQTHQGVNEGMNLEEPQGFRQHALDSLGVMAGQLPIPGKAKAEAATDTAKGALQLMKKYGKKALGSPFEYLSPTVDPRMSNYVLGTAAGGGMGALGDEVPLDELEPPPRAVTRAKGGKVGALTGFLKSLSLNPDATFKQTKHVIGDPVEEVLHAANEGQRKGVLSSEEAKRIRELMAAGEEEELADALLDLQNRLFKVERAPATLKKELVIPTKPAPKGFGDRTEIPGVPNTAPDVPLLEPLPTRREIPAVPPQVVPAESVGRGTWDVDKFNREILGIQKARGGLAIFHRGK